MPHRRAFHQITMKIVSHTVRFFKLKPVRVSMHNNNKAVAKQQMFLARFLSLKRLSLTLLDGGNEVLQRYSQTT